MIDNDELLKQLKVNTKKEFTIEEGGLIEKIINEEEFDSTDFKESLITFSDVLKSNKRTNAIDYIKAVQFCSHMSIGSSQYDAYVKTFPDRVAAKSGEGTVRASASIYHKTQLVQGILSMAQVPAHLIFMSERHKAIEKLVSLMNNEDATHRIQMESADKILSHIKPPEESKITLDVNVNNDALDSLEKAIETLATNQVKSISDGKNTAQDVVDAELVS